MALANVALGLGFGLLAAVSLLWWLVRSPGARSSELRLEQQPLSFLFEGGQLIDASSDAESLLISSGESSNWAGIVRLFQSRFVISSDETSLPDKDGVEFFGAREPGDGSVLEIRKSGNRVRLDLTGPTNSKAIEDHTVHLMKEELNVLEAANSVSPFPIWKTSEEGLVTWFNPAYQSLMQKVQRSNSTTGQQLFRLPDTKIEIGKTRRIPVSSQNPNQTLWFDVQRMNTPIGDFYSAVDANAIVRAEAAQRNFVQTLAKTFAHLPIGLAIFDENRQLVLFNPAVIDLTGLGADFLSARPSLLSFFDELRNQRLMPEPKNYNSWRQQIADLVAAAADGRYSETWTLDSGRTYRVNGRPHPDGAIAFLIEDISAEVSLTRRFRAELELGQSVLDTLESAVAVFSSTGVLTVSNTAYRMMWSVDPDSSFAEVTIIDCLRDWQNSSLPSPVWGDLRDFVLEYGDRAQWHAAIERTSGGNLEVDAVPLVSGATMIRFQLPDKAEKEDLREAEFSDDGS